ncbi:class I SAM-dependent methyltransferase [Streptomyces profundus]|uniref:class I SAM-dependent methyltransferase n=1 Tax=Streptomyces profundus TaxID=2867410 RepID=UPI001D16BEA8|nr:class I SAM-dependent methyltransferase [Streptomyces sp. MA3_2.13]UED85450.1 class I SAM-dependent methyltransferase [Streptomyces sp. MA3_2.13]
MSVAESLSSLPPILTGGGAGDDSPYIFDSAWDRETERLRANEALWDQGTIERLNRLGVSPGWTCLEVGAGRGSIADWLGERVGTGGRVVAADLETAPLDWIDRPQVEVAKLDLRGDQLPSDTFDLIHARMVLQHLEDRDIAVTRMVRALKPGGVLFLEDTDSLTLFRSAVAEDFLKDVHTACYDVMARAGYEARGGQLDLEAALATELVDVSAEGRAVMVRGGTLQARMYVLWLEYLRPKLLAAGLLTEERVNEALAALDDPGHRWLSQVLISTYGRKPR